MMPRPTTLGRRRLRAEAALLLTTMIWATTSVAGRWLVGDGYRNSLPESLILAIRFTAAALVLAAVCPWSLRVRGRGHDWRVGLWLGLLLGITFHTQLIGQRTISASRSHFLTNLCVLIVPLLQTLHLRCRPGRGPLVGVALAVAGLLLLTDPLRGGLLPGDGWTLLCAVAYSLYIIELQRLGEGVDLPRLLLAQFTLIAAVSWALAVPTGGLAAIGSVSPSVWALFAYLAVICTLGSTWLHNRLQRDTTPTRTVLIFATGPVMTLGIAWVTLGEALAPLQILGAGLILLAIIATETL